MNEYAHCTSLSPRETTGASHVQIMLDAHPFSAKPTKQETAALSNRLIKATTVTDVATLAKQVGTQGVSFVPALLNGGGRKAENWVEQQVFCLDFDENLRLEQFDRRSQDLKVLPAFVYTTFSHTDLHHKFRAVYVTDAVVTDSRLRYLVTSLLMKLFPEADKACTDGCRIFFGGKGLYQQDLESRINCIQLINAWSTEVEAKDYKNFARKRKNFTKKMGLAPASEQFGVFLVNDLNDKNEDINIYSIIDNKEKHQKSSISPVLYEGLWYGFHWDSDEKGRKPAKEDEGPGTTPGSLKPDAKSAKHLASLKPEDLDRLSERCRLFREFHNGQRRLPHRQRRLLLSNLRWYRNGLPIYREGLRHFDSTSPSAAPYPDGDRELMDCADRYNFSPESCSHCPFAGECTHGTNLLQQIRLRRGACRKVAESSATVSLATARDDVRQALSEILLQNGDLKDFSILQADCGVGKTEALLELLPQMDQVCVAFPTHRLAQEAYGRLTSQGDSHGYFLWPERPPLPQSLQTQLDWNDRMGLAKTQELLEAALEYDEVRDDPKACRAIESYLEAYSGVLKQSRVFCTHEKAIRLMENRGSKIQTCIFDEDPMKSLFKIDQIRVADVDVTIKKFKSVPSIPPGVVEALQAVVNAAPNQLVIPNRLPNYPGLWDQHLFPNEVSSPVLSLLDCTGYIKPLFDFESVPQDVFSISHRALSDEKKYVTLSATPILPLYEKAYGDRLRVWKIAPVEQQGKLILHRDRSYSRASIKKLGNEFVPQVEGYVETFGLEGLITFKEWGIARSTGSVFNGGSRSLPIFSTFGATEGFNSAAGKNIGVIGTPHLPEYAIKLLGHAAGASLNGVEFKFEARTVRRHEFELSVYCISDDAFFQALEFAIVERELVQAAGRARLLQNPCEVHVFSNYVLPGGELWPKTG